MILLIDNYDSFTYNIYQYISQFDEVCVFRNDKLTLKEMEALNPSHIVISPGPGTPYDAGISMKSVEYFKEKIPILGICLGHQCIAATFGGKVVKAKEIYHGKTAEIFFNEEDDIFKDIENPFIATRYHSLIVSHEKFPFDLKILALTKNDEIMAIKHKLFPIYGFQFHPESILTTVGLKLFENFFNIKRSVNYV